MEFFYFVAFMLVITGIILQNNRWEDRLIFVEQTKNGKKVTQFISAKEVSQIDS